MHPLSILVVEDVPETLDLIARLLSAAGHSVTCAPGGRAAVSMIREGDFDLVLTDMLMPEVDGIEVVLAARRWQPAMRVIVMTGGGDFLGAPDLLRLGRSLGADEQLSKPFSQSQLLAAIQRTAPTVAAADAE